MESTPNNKTEQTEPKQTLLEKQKQQNTSKKPPTIIAAKQHPLTSQKNRTRRPR
jgi:CDP-glycerol glycerophosphotransferase (TagB/SpsB family)